MRPKKFREKYLGPETSVELSWLVICIHYEELL